MAETRLPVTVLTGFLGAGKSTLLNKVLHETGAGKIAVIVNEFGEVGLDHDLIEAADDEVILLSSGCICCSIRGDLTRTLADLVTRREAGELDFERIVIETTGLADPAPIQQTLLVDRYLAYVSVLDGVVTLVDAANGAQTLDAQFEAVSQVATADLILMTKTDIAPQSKTDALRQRIANLNPTARIHPVSEATDNPALLWGLTGTRRDTTASGALAWLSRPAEPASPPDPLSNLSGLGSPAPAPGFSAHDSRIGSASITLEQPIATEVFDAWIDTIVSLRGNDLLRIKGIVFLEDVPSPCVFHGVQHIFDPPVPLRNWPEGDTTSRIVVIARDMTNPELQRSLDMLRATKAAVRTPPTFPGWQETEAQNWP